MTSVTRLRDFARKINLSGTPLFDEPMSRHTSFRVGGPADVLIRPATVEELADVLASARREGLPVLTLGAGANILVSDRGIRGIVLDMALLGEHTWEQDGQSRIWAAAGLAMSDLARITAEAGFAGLENFFAMPGSVGGSVWMNARCYERSISDTLSEVELLTAEGRVERMRCEPQRFSYKHSPFQSMDAVILRAAFALAPGDRPALRRRMTEFREDRERKGHFVYPCAGSVFKNNREFGMPSGMLIDRLGLRGARMGDAEVSVRHANIVVNRGEARARDVLGLVERIEAAVLEAYGFRLERELILVGEWDGERHGVD